MNLEAIALALNRTEQREMAFELIAVMGHVAMVDLLQASALEALRDDELLAFAARMRLLADSLDVSVNPVSVAMPREGGSIA